MTFRKIDERYVHEGSFVRVVRATFEGPDGDRFDREIVRHRGAVGVLALTDDGAGAILVRQYRPTVDEELLEIPAGLLDVDGESAEDAARRELEEEIGRRATGALELVTEFFVAVGMTDERLTLYLCRDSEPCPTRPQSAEEERMSVEEVTFDEADEMIADGRIKDAKTIIALLLAQRIVGRA